MISTIRVVAMTLNLVRRHNNPLFIFSSPSEQSGTDVLDFGRVAVLFVAATFKWLVGHVPGRVRTFRAVLVRPRQLRRDLPVGCVTPERA
jgi:hypothetical protein